jgi:hypothetical protein
MKYDANAKGNEMKMHVINRPNVAIPCQKAMLWQKYFVLVTSISKGLRLAHQHIGWE